MEVFEFENPKPRLIAMITFSRQTSLKSWSGRRYLSTVLFVVFLCCEVVTYLFTDVVT